MYTTRCRKCGMPLQMWVRPDLLDELIVAECDLCETRRQHKEREERTQALFYLPYTNPVTLTSVIRGEML